MKLGIQDLFTGRQAPFNEHVGGAAETDNRERQQIPVWEALVCCRFRAFLMGGRHGRGTCPRLRDWAFCEYEKTRRGRKKIAGRARGLSEGPTPPFLPSSHSRGRRRVARPRVRGD